MNNDYTFETIPEWDSFSRDRPTARAEIIGYPIETWLDYSAKDQVVETDLPTLLVACGYLQVKDKSLVATDPAVVSRILAERFAEKLLAQTWDDQEAFNKNTREVNSFCILNKQFETAFPDAIVLLHNLHERDVVRRAAESFQSDSGSFWRGVAAALPFLKLDLPSLLGLLDEAMVSSANGSNGFEAYASVHRLGQFQPEFARELLSELENSPNRPAFDLISSIAAGVANDDFENVFQSAMQWMRSPSANIAAQGIYALGAFEYGATERTKQKRELFDEFNKPFESRQSEVLVAIVTAAKSLLKNGDPEVVQWIRRLSVIRQDDVEASVANFLLNKRRDFSGEAWFRELLCNLLQASHDIPKTVSNIDLVLGGIAEDDAEFVKTYIEKWIISHDYDTRDYHVPITSTFKSTFNQLGRTDLSDYEYLLTRWFLADDERLHRAASNIADDLAGKIINDQYDIFHLDQTILAEIGDSDAEFLMRKILGYVDERRLLASLSFSIANAGKNATKKDELVSWAFRSFVGYNYYGAATELLEKKVKDGNAAEKRIAQKCIDKLGDYYEKLKEPIPKELQPSRTRIHAYRNEIQKLYRRHSDLAMKASPLLSVVTTMRLLFGKKAAIQIDGGKTQFSELISHGFSMEESRGDALDPMGMKYRRWRWRQEQRGGDEADN